MIIKRSWAMPNKNTFDIRPIKDFIESNILHGMVIDPFANKNKIADITNDLDASYMDCTYNMDAIDFLKIFGDNEVTTVLFDPPYSPRQISESYKRLNMSVNMQTTQSSFWAKLKDEISRITKPGGKCISFGWNSQGIGIKRGFRIDEILLVAHGGSHNDTICLLETKL